jgi:hypothetical protein
MFYFSNLYCNSYKFIVFFHLFENRTNMIIYNGNQSCSSNFLLRAFLLNTAHIIVLKLLSYLLTSLTLPSEMRKRREKN